MEHLVLIPWTASAVASPQNQIPSEYLTRAKPAFAPSCLRRTVLRRGEGGAGGDRTLVQTTATWAFYMRSFFIGFRPAPGEGHPSVDLGPVSYLCFGPPHRPVYHDDTSDPGRRLTGLPERYSFPLLLFTGIKPNSLGLLSCESVVVVACYSIVALGYGSHHTPGMLTHITKPLSNPCRPREIPKNWCKDTVWACAIPQIALTGNPTFVAPRNGNTLQQDRCYP